jgi:hypothetical protein
MTCPACGSRNERGVRFCSTCGAKLELGSKAQVEYEYGVLPGGTEPKPAARTAALSKLSLVLGLISLTPLTFLAGIPAVVTALIALKQRRPGAKRAYAGLITGAFGSAVLTFLLGIPYVAGQQEVARVAKVKASMEQFHRALDKYAAEHGSYPSAGISWSSQVSASMAPYFEGAMFGEVPFNPYTGMRYEAGRDLFYLTGALSESGLEGIDDRSNPTGPLVGLAAPRSVPGTIMILGDSEEGEFAVPIEYAIIGYGRNTSEPMSRNRNGPFFVLRSRK